jgi:hypothetical protein
MAESTTGPKSRELFTELGNSWLKLAVEFENAKTWFPRNQRRRFLAPYRTE